MKTGCWMEAKLRVCTIIDHSSCLQVTLAHLMLYFYVMTIWPDHHFRNINTDHIPILTELNLGVAIKAAKPIPNFKDVDWDKFCKMLVNFLGPGQPEEQITSQRQLDKRCSSLMEALQNTIWEQVPVTAITSKLKRWWTKELMQMQKQADLSGRQSFLCRNKPEHAVHIQHKEAKKRYVNNMEYNKRQHWRDWLEKADEPDIWTANRYVTAPETDSGKARIPVLKVTVDGEEMTARTNSKKSTMLAKGFFPPKPVVSLVHPNAKYPPQCQVDVRITADQLRKQLCKLKPYKAPGPDGIPNIVLMKCTALLTDSLLSIYKAMFECTMMYKPWKMFTTVVLRKPGKPRYNTPKAYRPIALLNMMWKVLMVIVADQLTFTMEKHQLLLANHFGGRPRCTTTDTMHLLANMIKASWRVGKVTSALFLDIEGAFPNTVPSHLEHNLCKCHIPSKIIKFICKMLQGRVTTLKFDGYTSEPINIDNGIGQGDPLSMGLYQYYNADLIEVLKDLGESAMAYMDDSVMIAVADSFPEAHRKLLSMMTREGGVAISKSAKSR